MLRLKKILVRPERGRPSGNSTLSKAIAVFSLSKLGQRELYQDSRIAQPKVLQSPDDFKLGSAFKDCSRALECCGVHHVKIKQTTEPQGSACFHTTCQCFRKWYLSSISGSRDVCIHLYFISGCKGPVILNMEFDIHSEFWRSRQYNSGILSTSIQPFKSRRPFSGVWMERTLSKKYQKFLLISGCTALLHLA